MTTDSNLTSTFSAIGASKPDGFDIAPEDKPIADAILAQHPIYDTPHPHQIPEGWQAPPLRISALPPKLQPKVRENLERYPEDQRASVEARLVEDVVRNEMLPSIRVRTGLGPTATPYHKEMVQIAAEVSDLQREWDRLQSDIKAVDRYVVRRNPETGADTPYPVMRLQGTRLKAAEERQKDVARQIRLLVNEDHTPGIEGRRRVREALHASVSAVRALNQRVAEEVEVNRRADEINREARIHSRAEARARMRRNGG
ncbi:MAG: hypothetical protein KGL48_16230 [Sphingomonadales bacterium]|nr:hypothetical protein [Sphingomonadales bacterium]MDE2568066.1 hypothetical protein [Sphingomonadales bacterium]